MWDKNILIKHKVDHEDLNVLIVVAPRRKVMKPPN